MFLIEAVSHMTLAEALGWFVAALSIGGSAMKTIIPLRCLGIVTNILGIVYAFTTGHYPALMVHLVLLPINSVRLAQMLRLIAKVKRAAATGDLSMDWLKPFMSRETMKAGQVLFAKGEVAQCMFYTLSGRYRLKESGIDIPAGQVVGEMGLLAPDNRRTQTLECIETGEVLTITYDQLRQLYFQNPEFGFYFLRLTSDRMFQNMARLEAEVARLRVASSAGVERAA
jgi:CRP/FNR family transcriptional regulator, cyclic AMP receptor protein